MHVDQLEPRRLFAASAALSADGVLRVIGDISTRDISVLPSSQVNFAKLKGSPAAPDAYGDQIA